MLAASLDGNAGITAASRVAAEALLDAALASRLAAGTGRSPWSQAEVRPEKQAIFDF